MGIRMYGVLGGIYQKIDNEQKIFAAKMMEHDSEDVYQYTYRTDTVTNIDELLRESVKGYNIGQLLVLSAMGNVLEELLIKWLKTSEGYFEELSTMMLMELKEGGEVSRLSA